MRGFLLLFKESLHWPTSFSFYFIQVDLTLFDLSILVWIHGNSPFYASFSEIYSRYYNTQCVTILLSRFSHHNLLFFRSFLFSQTKRMRVGRMLFWLHFTNLFFFFELYLFGTKRRHNNCTRKCFYGPFLNNYRWLIFWPGFIYSYSFYFLRNMPVFCSISFILAFISFLYIFAFKFNLDFKPIFRWLIG